MSLMERIIRYQNKGTISSHRGRLRSFENNIVKNEDVLKQNFGGGGYRNNRPFKLTSYREQ